MGLWEHQNYSKKMSKTDESDSDGVPDYEDDFEKDLDWLINEDAEKHASIENHNVKEQLSDLDSDSTHLEIDKNESDRSPNGDRQIVHDDPNLTLDSASDFEEDEEAKRYIAEKIEEANKKLEMEIIDENRQRKLKFKESLVDLEIPPLEFPDSHRSEDVTDGVSQLYISDVLAQKMEHHDKNGGTDKESKDGKVLVEKEGKFELVSIQDVENLCSLPPINNNNKDIPKSPSPTVQSSQFGTVTNVDGADEKSISSNNNMNGFIPHPPTGSKVRPSSANNLMKSVHKVKPQRRVQSASVSTGNTTFSLSAEQKQQLKRFQERQEKLRKEMNMFCKKEEERKRQEEEEKKRENELAFKIWLQRKNEQLIQARRVKQAKELEEISTADEERDSKKAVDVWLKRKHGEYMTEKKMEELRKQDTFFHERKEREDAFAQWLTMKRKQKRAEQQAAKERSRRLLLEARRRKQIDNLLYSISDSKPFCYMNHM
ncbi:coiled-coil domain-containing protein 181 isoform X2 [Pseudophryne corroboree]|uniref:coiled-coil domain-containing protein 181 isoform X2 n=1 Tax=Pseudophryne corroboree TaxID=495146 RepID=UPI00308123F8